MGPRRPPPSPALVWVLAVLWCQLTVFPVAFARDLKGRGPLTAGGANDLAPKHFRALLQGSKSEIITQEPKSEIISQFSSFSLQPQQPESQSSASSGPPSSASQDTTTSTPSLTPTPSPEASRFPMSTPAAAAQDTAAEPQPALPPVPIPSPVPWFTPGEVPKAPSPAVNVVQSPINIPYSCIRKSQPFRVLTLGDSITEGAVPSKKYTYPYSVKLGQLLTATLGFQPEIKVAGNGGSGVYMKGYSSGGTILDTAAVVLAEGPYNAVVVAVGINDLLRGGYTADQIMERLSGLYLDILGRGWPIVAIPPLPAPGFVPKDDPKEMHRKLLAEKISEYVRNHNGKKPPPTPPMYILNVQATVMNFWNMDAAQNMRYVDDGLHLTEAGYDRLGTLVHFRISQNICKT